ncbi:hypothetical protein BG58_32985 [Caballeronia jiangsuensis]|nr:hypothetical protein BG58_32985 [Caballeronia jiangsuensis]
MANGSISLGEVAARSRHIEVACSRCERRGRYQLSRLVARLGEDFPMTNLAEEIADCQRQNVSTTERCDVYFPGLIRIMGDDEMVKTPTQGAGDDDY